MTACSRWPSSWAIQLQRWWVSSALGGRATSTVQLGHLVHALSRAETADEVAGVIAEAGAMAAGAEFANIAVADPGAGQPTTANLYHVSSLIEAGRTAAHGDPAR